MSRDFSGSRVIKVHLCYLGTTEISILVEKTAGIIPPEKSARKGGKRFLTQTQTNISASIFSMSRLLILAALQERERISRPIRPHRVKSFDLPENEFVKCFRLDKELVLRLVEELRPYIEPRSTIKSATPTEIKVLCALRFYATGSDQKIIGDDCKVGVSQQTVSRILRDVTVGINNLLTVYVKFPEERSMQEIIKQEFFEYCGLSGVLGAIDCTHVALIAPSNDGFHNERNYVNRKQFHSLNVQLVSDMKHKIMNVSARYPGSCHDSFIWRNSNLRRHMDYGGIIKGGGWLLGDSGYPREPWLKTPIQNPMTQQEHLYNYHHSRGRTVIERVNGILKSRFRCLTKARTLIYDPPTAGRIINACVVLHNICVENNIEWDDEPLAEEDEPFNTGDGTQ